MAVLSDRLSQSHFQVLPGLHPKDCNLLISSLSNGLQLSISPNPLPPGVCLPATNIKATPFIPLPQGGNDPAMLLQQIRHFLSLGR